MGTAVTIAGIIAGTFVVGIWLLLRADRKDGKVEARRADLTRARQDLATARAALRKVEQSALELQALDTALAHAVLKIIYDTREEIEKA